MKTSMVLVFLLLACSMFATLQVPFSLELIKTETNLMQDLLRVTPEDKEPESLKTKAWLWQDESSLNVHFECVIDSTFYPGAISTRDINTTADYLRVQLITIPDAYYSYFYMAFPTGNLLDAVRSSEALDSSFNSTYSYTTTHSDSLWQVTLKIPLAELRFKQQMPYNWKIILTRYNKTMDETFSQPYVLTKMKNDYFTLAQDIQLNHPLKRKLDLAFKPYIVKSYDLVNKTDSFDPDNLGLDIAFNPAQRTRIKLSYNPDYSDVPPDNAADNYNTKNPYFYSENRFFFSEDIDAFGVGSTIFHSRNIVQPQLAFKATGNATNLNWGILSAWDKEIKEGEVVANSDDYFQVLSIIPRSKKVRLVNALVSRTNSNYYNHVYNGKYRWDPIKDLTFTGTLYASVKEDDRETDAKKQEGYLTGFQVNTFPGNWNAYTNYTKISKDFAADAGSLYYTNYQDAGVGLGWDSDTTKNYVTYHGFGTYGDYLDFFESDSYEYSWGANYYINFRPQYGFSGVFSRFSEEDIQAINHQGYSSELSATYFKWEPLNVSLSYSHSKVLVYSLLKTYNKDAFYANIWGTISQVFKYDLSLTNNLYNYPNGIEADYGGLIPPSKLDNNYAIFNGKLSYTPNKKVQFSCGSGISTYERTPVYANLNIYGNLRYEFKPQNFLYLGFNSRQLQDAKSTYADPLGHFHKNSSTAYLKLALTL